MKPSRTARYNTLRTEHFTPLEAREFSKVPVNTPAMNRMRQGRRERWDKFEKLASTKINNGRWKRSDLPRKWLNNLSRMYSKMGFRVKHGPKGKQQPMAKRSPNPWELYRYFQKREPDKPGYESPWKKRRRGMQPSSFTDYSEIEELRRRQEEAEKREQQKQQRRRR